MRFSILPSFVGSSFLAYRSLANSWEHVVLANCISQQSIHISHMAYFSLGINSTPESVAVIPTQRNHTAAWLNHNGTGFYHVYATFPDGIFFNVNLSTRTNLAGIGYNGFGPFNCWQYNVSKLYSWYNGVICDAVYDCNHQAAAGDDKSLNASKTPTGPEPSQTNAESPGSDDNKSNEIALGVGIGLGLPSIIVAVIGVWAAWNRKHKHSYQQMNGNRSGGSHTPGIALTPIPVAQRPAATAPGSTTAATVRGSTTAAAARGSATTAAAQGSTPTAQRLPNVAQRSTSAVQRPSNIAQIPPFVAQRSTTVRRGPATLNQGSVP